MTETLDNKYLKIIEQASEYTNTDYGLKNSDMPIDAYKYVVEDLLTHIETLEERIEDIISDRDNNYTQKEEEFYEKEIF